MTTKESDTIAKINTKSWLAVIGIFTFFATAVGGYVLQGKSVADNTKTIDRHEVEIRQNADRLIEPRVGKKDIESAVESLKVSLTEKIDSLSKRVDNQEKTNIESIKLQTENSVELRQVKEILRELKDQLKRE